MRDGPTFLTCVAKLVVQEADDTQRITAEFPCSPDATHPVGGAERFSEVILDFETAYNHGFPLHPNVEYVDTFNVGIVEAKGRIVVQNPGQCSIGRVVWFSNDLLRTLSVNNTKYILPQSGTFHIDTRLKVLILYNFMHCISTTDQYTK